MKQTNPEWRQRLSHLAKLALQLGALFGLGCGAEATPPEDVAVSRAAITGMCAPGDQQYCNWMGSCNVAGTACVCFDAAHRVPEERCAIWHQALPAPGKNCVPGDNSYCSWMGTCNADGMTCTCDDSAHRLPEELCANWHSSLVPPGKNCVPGDHEFCSWMGTCASDGMLCVCDDAGHRSPADRCATWSPSLDAANAYADVVDLTEDTGVRVTGPLVAWQLPDGPDNVEHLAGIDSYGDLINWWRKPGVDWQSVNIGQQIGITLQDPLANWMTQQGGAIVEHIAGVSDAGHLIETWWQPGMTAWQAIDVTAATGVAVEPGLSAWLGQDEASANIERIAARTGSGELMVFSRAAGADWSPINVTALTGVSVAGVPTGWVMPDGPYLAEHVAVRGVDGALYVLWYRPDLGWSSVNATSESGEAIADRVTAWTDETTEYLAGSTVDQRLVVLSWSAASPHWQARDVARYTGDVTVGAPAVYRRVENGAVVTVLGVRGDDSDLYLAWHTDALDWQSLNLTEANSEMGTTRRTIASDPVGWTTPDGVEHFAARGPDDRLLVFFDHTRPRQLTDGLSTGPLSARVRAPRRVLAILWRANEANMPEPTVEEVRDALFLDDISALGYFPVVSNGFASIAEVDTVGWFDADYPPEHYFSGPDEGDQDNNGFIDGHVEKWTEAILKADATVDFASFDTNQNGVLDIDEVGIFIVMPSQGPGGFVRVPAGREYPTWEPLVVDGIRIPIINEFYAGYPIGVGTACHELSHWFDTPDMYMDWKAYNVTSYTDASYYSVLSEGHSVTHIDAFNKMRLGWLRPKIIFQPNQYSLVNVEDSATAWVLLDPDHATDEYFMVENRWKGSQYDRDIPDDGGLAVWHILLNADVYNSFVPRGIEETEWAKIPLDDWPRRAIQMVRPSRNIPFNDAEALWDGAQPGVDFDLLASNPDPTRGELRWADGTPSKFQITDISGAGSVMTATVGIEP